MKLRLLGAVALLSLACSRPERHVYVELTDLFLEGETKGAAARVLTTRIEGEKHEAFFVPGNGTFRVRLVVPPAGRLRFAPMLPPGSVVRDPSKVTFRVLLSSRGSTPQVLWSGARSYRSPRFRWVEIDLSRFAGFAIELFFETSTDELEDTEKSWALWAGPHILSTSRPRGKSSVLLITIDTLRADHLGAYGDTLAQTPTLDWFASNGTVFANAFSNFNVTNPSLVTLFTGLYGREHGVYDLRTPLPPDFSTLAEILKSAGYKTGAVVSVAHMSPALSGLQQGFDEYYVPPRGEWPADTVTVIASHWLERHGRTPFFLWVHYFDPHMPYSPPESLAAVFCPDGPEKPGRLSLADTLSRLTDLEHLGPAGRDWLGTITNHTYPEAMYRAEIAFVDQQIGRLWQTVRELLLESQVTLVITADHGESLGEHAIYYDHIGLYKQQIHVPLIFYAPGFIPSGRYVESLISVVDLLPTILDMVSMAPALEVGGFSFASTIFDGKPGERSLIIAQHADNRAATFRTDSWSVQKAWLPYSVVQVDARFFDLEVDPEEHNNRMKEDLRARKMLSELEAWLSRKPQPVPEPAKLDQQTREHLEALGYIIEE
jgi:arylsulfatase A-like enzyme